MSPYVIICQSVILGLNPTGLSKNGPITDQLELLLCSSTSSFSSRTSHPSIPTTTDSPPPPHDSTHLVREEDTPSAFFESIQQYEQKSRVRAQVMSGNNWQEEAMRRLRQMQQARGGAGMGGGGPPQIPKGSPALLAAGVLLVGGAYVFSNSLFNVDGGQRAIKYRRVSGVSKEIYNEGEQACPRGELCRETRISGGISFVAQEEGGDLGDRGADDDASQERTSTSPGSRRPSSTTSARSRATCPP